MGVSPGEGFAYLFERFPSFTQTFCFREVLEMRRQGVRCPVWSIRDPRGEPRQDFPAELDGLTTYLPDSFESRLESDAGFRRSARRAIGQLHDLWGGEGEKRRIYEALWLIPELRRVGISYVHVHFAGTAARTAFWLKKLAGVRYSFTAHANDIFCDEPHERLEMLIREAECVVTVSDFAVRYLCERFPQHCGKFHRVYNGIHVERFQREAVATPRPLVLSVGRYIEKKGFPDLIAACRALEGDFECLIVGQGPMEDALRAAAEGDARIRVTGPRSEEQIIEMFARAAVFVLPCIDEEGGGKDNLPTVIMEAMAAGVPVISTPVAGVPEMVEHGVTGWLVPQHDATAITVRLREVFADPVAGRAKGEAGRRACAAKFAVERTVAELRRCLAEHRAFSPAPRSWISRILGRDA